MDSDELFHPKNLLPGEGLQAFSKEEAKDFLKRLNPNARKKMCVVKDERPSFMQSREWKQTFSLLNKEKVKHLKGVKCV